MEREIISSFTRTREPEQGLNLWYADEIFIRLLPETFANQHRAKAYKVYDYCVFFCIFELPFDISLIRRRYSKRLICTQVAVYK